MPAETGASPNPYRGWRVRIFALTWFTYASYYFCRQPFFIVKASLERHFGIDETFLGHIGTTYLVAYMIGQFTSAAVGRKLGARLLLLLGMAATILINVVFGLSNSAWTILVFMGLNGLAQGTGWSGVIGAMAHWFRRTERGQVMGVWATCYQIGAIAAKSYAALLLGLWGWRYSFFGGAVVTLVVWGANLLWLRSRPEDVGLEPLEDDEDDPRAADGEQRAKAPAPTSGPPAKEALGWTPKVVLSVVMCGLTYFCLKFLRYALWSWAPLFIEKTFGVGGTVAGGLSVGFDVGGFAGVIVAGVVSDRIFKGRRSHTALIMILGLVASCVLLYTVGSTSMWAMALCFALVGFMLYGPDFLVSGAGAIDVGSKRGAIVAAGLINGIGSIGAILQEQLIPLLRRTMGEQLLPVFSLFVGIAMLGAVAMFGLWIMGRKGWSRF